MLSRKASAAVVFACMLAGPVFAGQLPDLNHIWQSPVVLVRDDGKLYILASEDPSPDGYVVELYDPKSGSTDLPQRPPVSSSGRSGSTDQVVLSGGRLLVCMDSKCQLYLPSTNQWQAKTVPGWFGTPFVILDNGQILRAGGYGVWCCTAEGYVIDPLNLEMIARVDLNDARDGPAIVKLRYGRVLAAGGGAWGMISLFPVNSAEIFDPKTRLWTRVAQPGHIYGGYGYLLPDGRALVETLSDDIPSGVAMLAYDPTLDHWSSLPPLKRIETCFLPNGTFLISGGFDSAGNITGNTSIYDPLTGSTRTGRPMRTPRTNHVASVLPDGSVLVMAGFTTGVVRTKSVEQIYWGESKMTATLDPGYYVVSTTQDQYSTDGFWGVEVHSAGALDGGLNFGGMLPAAGKDVGFGAFYISQAQTVSVNLNLQALPGTTGPLEFTLRLLDVNKQLVAGPVSGTGNLQWSQALQPGFYVVEIRSSDRAPAASFQLALNAPHLEAGASAGAVLNRTAGVPGFVAFYLPTKQDVQIKLCNENTYGRPRGVGEVTLTLYDATGRVLQAVGPGAP